MAVFTFFFKCRLKICTSAETVNPQRPLSNGCSIYCNVPNQLLQSSVLTGQMEMSFTTIRPRNDIILWKKCSKCYVLIMHQVVNCEVGDLNSSGTNKPENWYKRASSSSDEGHLRTKSNSTEVISRIRT